MAKLIAHVDPTLEDYIEAAALAERVPIDEYAGALLQVGWDAVFGFRRSDRFPRAASASRQAELRARFVELRASLPHGAGRDGHRPGRSQMTDDDDRDQPLLESDDLTVPGHDESDLDLSRTRAAG
ncbi:MAG TPA: hypothetical protein VN895_10380 [Candidatus Acidoferrum sp.]|jgi:hypothetical protein|nr:hypothetical protein [Candidatus Acidoferrum sp.]